jgi:Tfp pilus assembly protein PilN
MKLNYTINLFPAKEQSLADKIVYFAFHYLRYILVATQLVVIMVFFYRFQIDQQIIDLKDSIKQKQEIVTISSSLLNEMKTVDTKIKHIETIVGSQVNYQSMFTYFLSLIPEEFTLTRVQLTGGNIEFEGISTNAEAIRVFNQRLLNDKRFKKVEMTNLKKNESGFAFSFVLQSFVPTKT